MRDQGKYYISTGQKTGFYTLRVEFEEPEYYKDPYGNTFTEGMRLRDWYVMTLAVDPDTAIQKAKAYLASIGNPPADLSIGFDLQEIRRGLQHDAAYWSVFQGGKYAGVHINDVIATDPEYAYWAAENMTGAKYAGTVELLREALAPGLRERAAARGQEQASRESRKAQAAALLSSLANALADGQGGFRDSVAQTLRKGELPTGRGLTIMLDILGKQAGRGNSKAYWAHRDEIAAIIDEVADLEG